MLKKRYTCYPCGYRTHRDTSQVFVNTGERIKCPECGEFMTMVSVEELGLPRAVEVEG